MFTDERRYTAWEQARQSDLRQFASILTPERLTAAAVAAGVKMGRGLLNVTTLVWLALASALRPGMNFAHILAMTVRLLSDLGQLPQPAAKPQRKGRNRNRKAGGHGGGRHKNDPRGQATSLAPTEEAFTQARALMPGKFWIALILLLGEAFDREHEPLTRWRGFRLLALDGTCLTLPRWKTLGQAFGYAKNGKGRPSPQARMVMLLLPTVRMPWRYELVPAGEGERTVAKRLLAQVRRGDLVLMDRGFFSYGLFRQVQDAGASFAVRLQAKTKFRTLRRLGPKDRLVRWKPSGRQWKVNGVKPRIDLRVIDYRIKGFRPSAIVTNVLDDRRVSRGRFVGLSESGHWVTESDSGLYHRRWQIETAFREIKRTQGMAGGLRGRTRASIEYEVAGHVLLHLLVRWLMVEAAVKHGQDPLRLSFKEALTEILETARTLAICTPRRRRHLIEQLLERIAAAQVPLRPGRSYPRPNDGKTRRTGTGKVMLPSKLPTKKA
jgi:hypothetical protein